MIDRYSRDVMKQIWSEENRYKTWLEIEVYACEALNKSGIVPDDALKNIQQKAGFDIRRIHDIEQETRHDVIAFTTSVSEHIGQDARYIHWGLTSSDVLDTSFGMLLQQAGGIILSGIDSLLEILKQRAFEHKDTVMIGRTHGIHAEPITFGLKIALWYDEMRRNRQRFERAIEGVSVGKISGAVGTFAHVPPFVEAYVCEKCGLTPAPVSSQIIQRDVYAEYFNTIALIGSSLEKFSVEIRHLQRTEVSEAAEHFAKGQKGSSAMPHKKNPILSENISGLARMLRGYAVTAMENIPLWHERDISHSSVERIIAPDSTILIDFMLFRFTNLIRHLDVYPENMLKNLDQTLGLYYSQKILLELTLRGVSREDGYRLVQKNAHKAWSEKTDFKQTITADPEITGILPAALIEEVCSPRYYLRHVDDIFKRVFS